MEWKLVHDFKGTGWFPTKSKRYEAEIGNEVVLIVIGKDSFDHEKWEWLYLINLLINNIKYEIREHVPEFKNNLEDAQAGCLEMARNLGYLETI